MERADFPSCTLYVTCEPCIMCAGALSLLGFKEVIFGCRNDKFGGNGSILQIHETGCGSCGSQPNCGASYPSTGGLLADRAVLLLQLFYSAGNPKGTFVGVLANHWLGGGPTNVPMWTPCKFSRTTVPATIPFKCPCSPETTSPIKGQIYAGVSRSREPILAASTSWADGTIGRIVVCCS